ncbi:hypothetical protein AB0F91_11525 [Amycolatopsis sp. NPDC023774]|uniref:hypothetical protein n=1 Tax=Amycolatopsis sp. NPDC023774 TaxID=3155015 RepID=UPI0033CCC475
MDGPTATRPHMPGYGIAPASAGLLPWHWADERLRTSHDYWLATVTPAGLPHLMPGGPCGPASCCGSPRRCAR